MKIFETFLLPRSHSLSVHDGASASASASPSHQSSSSSSSVGGSLGLVPMPRCPPESSLFSSHPETLFGLAEKFAAVESAVFLARQFSALVCLLKMDPFPL